MDVQLFNRIIGTINDHHGLTHDCMKILIKCFPEQNYDTLYSILSLQYQKRMKCNHVKNQKKKSIFWKTYCDAVEKREKLGIIVKMSEEFDVAPCLLGKFILSRYFENAELPGQQDNLNIYLRDTKLIPDKDLACEIFLCTLYDNIYSPLTETMKSSLGQQYEVKLYKEVTKLGLAFRDEENLRRNGYDKTPDCKLEVPVIMDGSVVNWIESKALFGNEDVHREYMENQYLSYWNRFGPGLVIYWFGYIETIVGPTDKKFIIRDQLPNNIIHLSTPNFDMS